eukprot:scaffold20.g7878.t1
MASDARQPDPRVAAQRKALIHVANWQIMDERHRKLAQIDDSVTFLRRICDNVRSQPDEPKFRKIKLTNPTFTHHVRDAPGGEAFLKEAGWHVKVEDFEKFWVYDARPGSVEWQILEEACKELDKLVQLVTDKKRRAAGDNKAETQRRLESIASAPLPRIPAAMSDLEQEHPDDYSEEEYAEEEGEHQEVFDPQEGVDEDLEELEEEGVEEYEEGDEEDGEIADDEEDQPSGGGGGAGGGGGGGGGPQQQMVYIPGLGYIPLANLGNLGGLLGGAAGGGAAGGGAARAPAQQQPDPEGVLREEVGRAELTVLLLGKGGVGKSSTVNSLLHERAANVTAFQTDTTRPVTFSRQANGFTLHLIDTPSLLEQDAISESRLEQISEALRDRPVDAVLFVDRLDSYAVGPLDKQVIAAVSRAFGAGIWHNAVVTFTHAAARAAPPGVEFDDFVKAAIRRAGAPADAELPVALVENSSRCDSNADGELIVPGDLPWVTDLQIAEVALNIEPFQHDPAAAERASNPNRRRKWLIPLVLAAQVALKLLLDRVMDEDGCKGDGNGPFDEQTVKERRAELKQEREARKRKDRKAKVRAAPSDDEFAGLEVEEEEEDDDY